jgi:hypothetical protein
MNQIELSRKPSVANVRVNTAAIIWVTLMVVLFVAATFVAHAQQFAAAETVFLNLTVSITSAAAGAFIGERLAIGSR